MSLGLLGAYESGSDSDSDSEQDDLSPAQVVEVPEPIETLANPFGAGTLGAVRPKPSFMQEQERLVPGVKSDNSVFSNPFRDKEEKKQAILEQHVNMTRRQEEMKVIDGKKVCWMYRKGRCRQGAKCKFGHDNDVKTDRVVPENKYDVESQISNDKAAKGAAQPIKFNPNSRREPTPEKEEDVMMRKRRPGLSEGLVPSKKAMMFHQKVYK